MPDRQRIPPGQTQTQHWPVMSHGATPGFDPATWDFRIFGAVETPRRLVYEEVRSLPRATISADFHCVTAWSRLDNRWTGVLARDVAALVAIKAEAQFVLVHCDGGYSTNLPLSAFLDDDVIFADQHDGHDLEPDHGWPLRLVVPKLYAWKSAKWVRAIEFLSHERRGFWETRGYHAYGDPWTEQRFA
ncbi:MAG: sulfite oxidase-like oxidoreductase [Deltaproteobacteria bacterium]|nr:sulfite oxidase-like oxidoreductase [Deltaproteobacteria bacterium]